MFISPLLYTTPVVLPNISIKEEFVTSMFEGRLMLSTEVAGLGKTETDSARLSSIPIVSVPVSVQAKLGKGSPIKLLIVVQLVAPPNKSDGSINIGSNAGDAEAEPCQFQRPAPFGSPITFGNAEIQYSPAGSVIGVPPFTEVKSTTKVVSPVVVSSIKV